MITNKKVLLVNQHVVPLSVDILNAFAVAGHKVTLFSGHVELGKTKINSHVRWVRSFKYRRGSASSRILSWAAFSFHLFCYLLFSKQDKILAVTNPPFAPLITFWISRVKKVPYYILIYDLYPDALAQAHILKSRNWIFKKWQKLNYKVFACAGKIFTLSESMKDAISVYVPHQKEKIKVIHNWVDTDYIKPLSKDSNGFVKKYGLLNKIVVLYAGNMGLTHDLESVIEAANLLKDEDQLFFLFIGEGGKQKKLGELIKDYSLRNILLLPYQSTDQFPLAMAAADIGIVTLGTGAEGISVPSKTYVNMAAGLCLVTIAPGESELTRLVKEYKMGFTIKPGQALELSELIRRLCSDSELLSQYKRNARAASQGFSPMNAYQYVEEMSNPLN